MTAPVVDPGEPQRIRALTVQQPWAWAIIHGGKTVENRTQLWKYRGPLAIHAGVRWSERGAASLPVRAAWWNEHDCCADGEPVPDESLPRYLLDPEEFGAIIGVVDLVDAHWSHPHCCDGNPWAEHAYVEHGGTKRVDIVHLVLENPRPVEPIDCKGRLGLWTLPAPVAAALDLGEPA